MAHRILTDRAGSTWQVWAVLPAPRTGARKAAVAPEYQEGWLAFERVDVVEHRGTGAADLPDVSGRALEKRRLAPIPASWEEASDVALLDLLATATPVTTAGPRARRSTTTDAPPPH